MRTCIATLAKGDYWKGAKVLFSTLRKYGSLPDSVDVRVMGGEVSGEVSVPVDRDYSAVPVNKDVFPLVAEKFSAWTLDYDRIIIVDADVMCVGDCSYLWSEHIGRLPFYACRDTAAAKYYPHEIKLLGLDASRLFNAGVMVVNTGDFLENNPIGDILAGIANGCLKSYDGGDQGYLNAYFQMVSVEIGYLPPEYNVCLDPNMPSLPSHAERLIHFSGCDANPWQANVTDWRAPYYDRWRAEYDAP